MHAVCISMHRTHLISHFVDGCYVGISLISWNLLCSPGHKDCHKIEEFSTSFFSVSM